ncbi:hypothetical protein [Streptomyces cyanogenus]|uniref:Uncharacterized protein n=1 Tax=Streptomyces cyanogenus TaxID=80860 RepID=A0ABX7TVP8_STRCY|nr:hypothetical protein [Streptomyces cyanogenus]QTE00833.1 hypothetical protein S1361_26105 [Streptomyces cyanogenus]
MAGGVARVRLDDGTVVWARIAAADEEALDEDGYRDTGLGDRVIDMAGGLAGTVGGVVRSLRADWTHRPPSRSRSASESN